MYVLTSGFNQKANSRSAKLATFLILIFTAFALPPAFANHDYPAEAIKDEGGPDDEPGQKDLNTLSVSKGHVDGTLWAKWTHDIVETTGENSADSCAVFDNNGDGNANYMLCVSWQNTKNGDPTIVGGTALLYECDDKAPHRCTGNAPVSEPEETHCSLEIVDDAFGARSKSQASDQQDMQIECEIVRAVDIGDSAVLTNVCSYPSQEPTSDPSDCILDPQTSFLEISKVCRSFDGDGELFPFTLQPPGQLGNDTVPGFDLGCTENQSIGPLRIDNSVATEITEVVDEGFLVTASCAVTVDGVSTPVGTFDGVTKTLTLDAFEVNVGQTVSCEFINSGADEPGGTGNIIISKISEGASCIATWFFSSLGKFDLCVADNLFDVPPAFQTRSGNTIEFLDLDPEAAPLSSLYDQYRIVDLSDGSVIAEATPTDQSGEAAIAGDHLVLEKSPIAVTDTRFSDFFKLDCVVTDDDNGIEESIIDTVQYVSVTLQYSPEPFLGHLAIIDLAPGETVTCGFVNVKRRLLKLTDDGVADYDLYAEVGVDDYLQVATASTDGDMVDDGIVCLMGVEEFCYYLRPTSGLALLRPSVNDIDGFDGGYALCPAGETPLTATCTGFTVDPASAPDYKIDLLIDPTP